MVDEWNVDVLNYYLKAVEEALVKLKSYNDEKKTEVDEGFEDFLADMDGGGKK